jgi:hypothetical protein
MDQIPNILPQLSDPRLEVYFIAEFVASWRNPDRSNAAKLIARAFEQLDLFDDSNLKCVAPFY